MTESTTCPFCESEISSTAKKCKHCGEWVSRNCQGCGTPIRGEWAARGLCAECQTAEKMRQAVQPFGSAGELEAYRGPRKSKGAAVFLALILGGLGAHKFYLERPGMGLFYLLLCWTLLPSLAGLLEGLQYLFMSEETFQQRFRERRL